MTNLNKIFSLILLIFTQIIQANDDLRQCKKKDLIGTWHLTHHKVLDEDIKAAKDNFFYLIQPYQIRIYREDNSIWTATSNEDLSEEVKTLSKFSQNQYYKIDGWIISTLNSSNKAIDMYQCIYYTQGYPKANIKPGSISLIWYRNQKQSIANLYYKNE